MPVLAPMKRTQQTTGEILASLRPLDTNWQDEVALKVIDFFHKMPVQNSYSESDIQHMLDEDFVDGLLICRLFLGLSKDQFSPLLTKQLGEGGTGIARYQADKSAFIEALINLGVAEKMAEYVNRKVHWADVLIERLRAGRGSAISRMKHGRDIENFVEIIVRNVFGSTCHLRCNFSGLDGKPAKCDFAIPGKDQPRIIIQAKGFATTESRVTDVIGDFEKIIKAKRHDTVLLFFTDGTAWNQRPSDLAKIIKFQNEGFIARIYTFATGDQFEQDLRTLKAEFDL